MKKIFLLVSICTSLLLTGCINGPKLVCKSDEGNITIYYNENTITGYSTSGLTYDLDEQKEYAESVGTKAYMEEFEEWFNTNTTGSCELVEE